MYVMAHLRFIFFHISYPICYDKNVKNGNFSVYEFIFVEQKENENLVVIFMNEMPFTKSLLTFVQNECYRMCPNSVYARNLILQYVCGVSFRSKSLLTRIQLNKSCKTRNENNKNIPVSVEYTVYVFRSFLCLHQLLFSM